MIKEHDKTCVCIWDVGKGSTGGDIIKSHAKLKEKLGLRKKKCIKLVLFDSIGKIMFPTIEKFI